MKIIYVASTEGPRRRVVIVVDSPLVRGILSEQELQKAGNFGCWFVLIWLPQRGPLLLTNSCQEHKFTLWVGKQDSVW